MEVIMVNLPEELDLLKKFHGHLGPYVVIGFRMGAIAREKLEGKLKAVSFTGSQTPLSCIIDGVQYSSSCTMGKGNISVLEVGEAKVHFLNDMYLLDIRLRDEVKIRIDESTTKETEELIALGLYDEPDNNLFIIIEVERTPYERTVKLK
jgi:formylmethanofuran dehydrogenase subunit E